jgi:hypothetical protein
MHTHSNHNHEIQAAISTAINATLQNNKPLPNRHGHDHQNQILSPSLFQAMPVSGLPLVITKTLALSNQEILGKSDAVWRSVTVYDAAEPFHVLHMDPGSNDE